MPRSKSKGYYAVAVGTVPGIYATWNKAKAQVDHFPGAVHKRFDSIDEATRFLKEHSVDVADPSSSTGPYYAVTEGDNPGIYTLEAAALSASMGRPVIKFEERVVAEEHLKAFGLTLDDQIAAESGHPTWAAREMPSDIVDPRSLGSVLVAFCDGSALRNGSDSARAAIACIFPHHRDWDVVRTVDDPEMTNNRAEYMAGIEALRCAKVGDPDEKNKLLILTSSKLLADSMVKHLNKWRNNGWRTAKNEPVKNKDLVVLLDELQGERDVEWIHVKAHSDGSTWEGYWNNLADLRAHQCARAADAAAA